MTVRLCTTMMIRYATIRTIDDVYVCTIVPRRHVAAWVCRHQQTMHMLQLISMFIDVVHGAQYVALRAYTCFIILACKPRFAV